MHKGLQSELKGTTTIIYSDIEQTQAWNIQNSPRKKMLSDISWSQVGLVFIFKSSWCESIDPHYTRAWRPRLKIPSRLSWAPLVQWCLYSRCKQIFLYKYQFGTLFIPEPLTHILQRRKIPAFDSFNRVIFCDVWCTRHSSCRCTFTNPIFLKCQLKIVRSWRDFFSHFYSCICKLNNTCSINLILHLKTCRIFFKAQPHLIFSLLMYMDKDCGTIQIISWMHSL